MVERGPDGREISVAEPVCLLCGQPDKVRGSGWGGGCFRDYLQERCKWDTIVYDSIDFTLFIDDKILTQDTIYHNTGIKLFRDNYYLKPGKHVIRIQSKKLDATYSYPFFNFLFVEIFVESSDFPPCFWITKHYFPLRRNII